MSDSELNKATHIQNEIAFISIKQENSNPATDLDMVRYLIRSSYIDSTNDWPQSIRLLMHRFQ